MWVRTQDKKELIDLLRFTATKSLSGKTKGAIYGTGMTADSLVVIGKFDTFEDALAELDNLEQHLTNPEGAVYQVR